MSARNLIRLGVYPLLLYLLAQQALNAYRFGDEFNGFDVSDSAIASDEILPGGPGRDGIPAIDAPHFAAAREARHLQDRDTVLGLNFDGVQRAYPIAILNWHEIVNDTINGQSITITYCPLCGSGIAYRHAHKQRFGVSGLLYNSDMLLYDRATESLWSQLLSVAISGPRKGERLHALPLLQTTWKHWRERYPATRVLSRDTGFQRDYDRSPYLGHSSDQRLYFPVRYSDDRFTMKQAVLGLVRNGDARAWPLSELRDGETLHDSLGDTPVRVHYLKAADTAQLSTADGEPLPAVRAYWFAWVAFYPDTSVYTR